MKRVVLLAVVGAMAGASPAARADEKSVCLDGASKGQALRDDHKLSEAREQFRVCAQAHCPAVVRSDCTAWLTDVERMLPTVVLSAKDHAGRDLLDVQVTVDGQPFATKMDGTAAPVDPGPHAFRFGAADGTSTTVNVVVKEGEKGREVAAVLGRDLPGTPSAPAGETPSPHGSKTGSLNRTLALIAGGVGLAGIAGGVFVGLDAKSKENKAAREAGQARADDSQKAVDQGNVATVIFVAGSVLVATGVVLWFTAPKAKSPGVGTNGHELLISGSF